MSINQAVNKEADLSLKDTMIVLLAVCVVSLISNWAGAGANILEALPGMIIIFMMVISGIILRAVIPVGFPAVAWVSLISVLLTLPVFPLSDVILSELKKLDFLAIVTPVLAYAALSIGKSEVEVFKKSGWKIALIAVLVFTGTFMGSVIVADFFLS